jgi:hypothetical protein
MALAGPERGHQLCRVAPPESPTPQYFVAAQSRAPAALSPTEAIISVCAPLQGQCTFSQHWRTNLDPPMRCPLLCSVPYSPFNVHVTHMHPVPQQTAAKFGHNRWAFCVPPFFPNSRAASSVRCWWKSKVWTCPVGAMARANDVVRDPLPVPLSSTDRHENESMLGTAKHPSPANNIVRQKASRRWWWACNRYRR